ncbi:hypothetical protein EMCRGX_G000696 [Ephydatia muelleri]
MLYLFLVQANGDAFSEVVFKPLENPPFWRILGVGIVTADWSKYQAKSIKLGMNQFSPLLSQKADRSQHGYGKRP